VCDAASYEDEVSLRLGPSRWESLHVHYSSRSTCLALRWFESAGFDIARCRAVGGGDAAPGLEFYAFPTLQQLGEATEAHLRASGFGYRSAFGCQDCFGAGSGELITVHAWTMGSSGKRVNLSESCIWCHQRWDIAETPIGMPALMSARPAFRQRR
jgi:hypothetical protein